MTKEQLSENIKNQETKLREYATAMNWKVIGVYNDEDWFFVKPALYLKTNVKITSGNGTETTPYLLGT